MPTPTPPVDPPAIPPTPVNVASAPIAGTIIRALCEALGMTPAALVSELGVFLGQVLAPMEQRIVDQVVAAIHKTAEVSKPNEELQKDFERWAAADHGNS